mmetsp:Transcript_15664/g.39053  ORF Transcript_15664/g.39053 Transcript_15664/m.39053 type:complete len:81 (+) Transcript_15664:1430-1672(+)
MDPMQLTPHQLQRTPGTLLGPYSDFVTVTAASEAVRPDTFERLLATVDTADIEATMAVAMEMTVTTDMKLWLRGRCTITR